MAPSGLRPDLEVHPPPLHHRLPHPPPGDPHGVASGTYAAPDHNDPSSLEIRLTAKDSGGLAAGTSMTSSPGR
jgi:hypothetical protein